jgi:hypothetical protein
MANMKKTLSKVLAFSLAAVTAAASSALTVSADDRTKPANGFEFRVGTIFAEPGQGSKIAALAKQKGTDFTLQDATDIYEAADETTQFAVLPVQIYKPQPFAGFKTAIQLTKDEQKIFTHAAGNEVPNDIKASLEHPYDDLSSPFNGNKFEYNADEWYFVTATNTGENLTAAEGDPVYFMNFIVADEAAVLDAAKNMKLKAGRDGKGNLYYSFPIEFNATYVKDGKGIEAVDTDYNRYTPLTLTAGAINVIVSKEYEGSSADVKATADPAFSLEKDLSAIKVTGASGKVTYQVGGKTVSKPADFYKEGTSKYTVDVLVDGTKATSVDLYVGVKGDANLDGKASPEDATLILIAAANVLNGDPATLGHKDAALEKLAISNADIDGSTTDIKNVTPEDATAILLYAAYYLNEGKYPTWKSCWSKADVDF